MNKLLTSEPVMSAAVTLVGALIALLVAFGINLTDTQKVAIGAFCVAVIGVAKAVRETVSPVAKTPAQHTGGIVGPGV